MKRALIIMFSVLSLCLLLNFSVSADSVLSLSAGADGYNIIIGNDAAETDRYAADTLSSYLEKITGESIAVLSDSDTPVYDREIVLGETSRGERDMSARKNGSYDIFTQGNRIFITGAGTKGTINGVYTFLENYCGCKWYTSGLIICPENDNLTVPADINYEYNTYFEYTETDWRSPCDTEYSLANGLNGSVYREISSEQGGKVGYITSFAHTLTNVFCNKDKYYGPHPEYFALRDGQRVSDQLCLTNEDVYKTVLGEVTELLKEKADPTVPLQIISLTQADNKNYCECDNCKKLDEENGSHSGSLLTFVNRIAKAVKDLGYDNIAIDTFAYQYTRQAPTAVRPENNVIIRLCTIECCFAHPLDDENCEENVLFMKDLKAWSEISDRLYIWDYTTNYAYTIGLFPDFGVIQKNMQIFYENSAVGIYEEGNYYINSCDTEFGELRAYLLSKLMQNPYCDYDSLMDGFLSAYYGRGGEYIKEFIDIISDRAASGGTMIIYSDMTATLNTLSEDDIARCDELWDNAKGKCTDKTQLDNIKRSLLSWRFWKACNRAGEFGDSFIGRMKENRILHDDLVAAEVTKYSEGSDFSCKAMYYADSPQNWLGSKYPQFNYPVLFSNILIVITYIISAICAIFISILAILKKQYLCIPLLPLFIGLTEVGFWNRRAFLAWKDIDEFVLTLIIFSLSFALCMICAVKVKTGKINAKKAVICGISGILIFIVPYLFYTTVINGIMFNGLVNKEVIMIALATEGIEAAIILHVTAMRLYKGNYNRP